MKANLINSEEPMEKIWERRHERLVSLLNASAWATSSEVLYKAMVDNLTIDLGCDAASIRLLTVEGSSFASISASEEIRQNLMRNFATLSIDTGRMEYLYTTQKPIVFDLVNPYAGDVAPAADDNLGFACGASALIVFEDKILGSFDILFKDLIEDWPKEYLEYLAEVGRILGALIQRENVLANAVELRVLEEGKRLGAEIHDNLAQLINASKLEVEMASIALTEGKVEKAQTHIDKAERASQLASDVVREEMIALRNAVIQPTNLVDGLQKLANDFGERWRIETTFSADETLYSANLSSNISLQVLRISHEALSNIFKHAQATKVTIKLHDERSQILLVITDDGEGFTVNEVPEERLGIKIMRERARSVRGSLEVSSTKGSGTVVMLRFPRA